MDEKVGLGRKSIQFCETTLKKLTLQVTKRCVSGLGTVAWSLEPFLSPFTWLSQIQHRLELRKEYERNARAASVAVSISLTDEEAAQELSKIGKARVVILGGGFGGLKVKVELARHGLDMVDVVVVDEKGWFEYTPAVLRTLVKGHFEEITTEFPRESPEFIQGKVVQVLENHVVLEGPEQRRIPFDYLLIASGASYSRGSIPNSFSQIIKAQPKPDLIDPLFLRMNAVEHARTEIEDAERILITGGGLVGVELAAEIAERYPRGKQVVLLHKHSELCGSLPPRSRQYVREFLETHGVEVVLDARVHEISETSCSYYLSGSDDKLHSLQFDLCFECNGVTPNSVFMEANYSSCLTEGGFIRVNDFLQVQDVEGQAVDHIFAIGDVCYHAPSSRFGGNSLYADLQGQVATSNLVAKLQGRQGDEMESFPQSLTGSQYLAPVSKIASLGELDGSMHVESFVVNGFFAALCKIVIEETKKLQLAGNPFGKLVWDIGDRFIVFAFREWFATPGRIIPTLA